MATTTVSDAVVVPQAQGTGLGSEDDNVDAASAALLAEHVEGEYVAEGMEFTRDDTNNEIDVGAGYCYIIDDSTSTGGSRGSGGNAQIQSTSSSGYDTEIPNDQVYLVIFPTTASVSVSDNTLSQIWVNITDVTSNNSVEIRSDSGGGTTSEPSDTFLKLGEINDSNTGNAERWNDGPPVWSLVATARDTDASTSLSLDTGTLPTIYDMYRIEFIGFNEASTKEFFDIRFNSDSTGNYSHRELTSNGVNTDTGKSQLRIAKSDNSGTAGKDIVTTVGEIMCPKHEDTKVMYHGNGVGAAADQHVVTGQLNKVITEVDEIKAISGGNARGRLAVSGKNLHK